MLSLNFVLITCVNFKPVYTNLFFPFSFFRRGPEDHTEESGIVIQHSCYGIRGASGGPLIRYDTRDAIGVFTSVTATIGEAVSTQCVWELLGSWLDKNVSCLSIYLLKSLA